MITVLEPEKKIPVIEKVDICVLGGSCTGVFAAVRAARLGARAAIIEKQNAFGGVAASGFVNVWHSLMNTEYEKQIIAGLTQEVIERLQKRDAVVAKEKDPAIGFIINTEELKIELDELVKENHIIPLLHTMYCAPYIENGKLKGIFIENKSGRSVIEASVFIDATGDGDLCRHLGMGTYSHEHLQPPSSTARFYGMDRFKDPQLQELIYHHHEEYNLPEDWGWHSSIPNMPGLSFHAETHIFNADCSRADELTMAEMEGRRHTRAIMDIVRKYSPSERDIGLVALPSYIGIRETGHIKCIHQLSHTDVLYGKIFDDAIANGTYRVDIHQADRPGLVFRYLDGSEVYSRTGYPDEKSRWRNDSGPYPTFYQIPFRSLVPVSENYDNVILAGRMIDADEGAFGAVRVMVNTNQMGEAAGIAAFVALDSDIPVKNMPSQRLRRLLKDGGSIII